LHIFTLINRQGKPVYRNNFIVVSASFWLYPDKEDGYAVRTGVIMRPLISV